MSDTFIRPVLFYLMSGIHYIFSRCSTSHLYALIRVDQKKHGWKGRLVEGVYLAGSETFISEIRHIIEEWKASHAPHYKRLVRYVRIIVQANPKHQHVMHRLFYPCGIVRLKEEERANMAVELSRFVSAHKTWHVLGPSATAWLPLARRIENRWRRKNCVQP